MRLTGCRGDTDPGDEMIVYAVSSEQQRIKEILVNAYGPYADGTSSDLGGQTPSQPLIMGTHHLTGQTL
jgi:hypothetical protein